jgi:hypothetical protein
MGNPPIGTGAENTFTITLILGAGTVDCNWKSESLSRKPLVSLPLNRLIYISNAAASLLDILQQLAEEGPTSALEAQAAVFANEKFPPQHDAILLDNVPNEKFPPQHDAILLDNVPRLLGDHVGHGPWRIHDAS